MPFTITRALVKGYRVSRVQSKVGNKISVLLNHLVARYSVVLGSNRKVSS